MQHYGIFSLFPPLVAIVLCFLTRNVVVSLFSGVFIGTMIIEANPNIIVMLTKSFMLFIQKVRASIASPWNAGILLQCLTIGGFVSLLLKSGGLHAMAEKISKIATSVRKTQLVCWLLGILIFFDDYANTFIVGPIMRPITDKFKISREKLAFIVDSTSAPIAGMALISTWIGYELGLIKESFLTICQDVNPYQIFISTIPYRFYNILMLIFILITILLLKEFGPMYKAEHRSRTTGKVLSDTAKLLASSEFYSVQPKQSINLLAINALIPVTVLIITTIGGFYYNGYKAIIDSSNLELINLIKSAPLSFTAIREIFGKADVSVVLFQSALFASIVGIVMYIKQKIFSLSESIEIFIQGMRSVLNACVILVLAWSLTSVIKDLGTAKYIVSLLSGKIPAVLLPSIVFITASIISFATGTSYGTMGILIPLVVPFAYSILPDQHFLIINLAGVLTGAIFGDHCSPISDTTILSSFNTACDHIDHTNTQLVYAIVVAIVSILSYLLISFNLSVSITLILTSVLLFVIVFFFGKKV